jgi:hypothetical protein
MSPSAHLPHSGQGTQSRLNEALPPLPTEIVESGKHGGNDFFHHYYGNEHLINGDTCKRSTLLIIVQQTPVAVGAVDDDQHVLACYSLK